VTKISFDENAAPLESEAATDGAPSAGSEAGAEPPPTAEAGAEPPPATEGEAPAEVAAEETPADAPEKTADEVGDAAAQAKKSDLDIFMESNERKVFSGKPITFAAKDADLVDVFRLVGQASGFNILLSSAVSGKVTMSVEDVPLDQVLEVILRTNKLGAERTKNILRIVPLNDLTQEKTAEARAKQALEATAPRVTRIFPISYAEPSDIQKMLQQFAKRGSAGGEGGGGTSADKEAAIQIDKRTNSIVVQDTMENIERAKRVIELLDTQTPQILVEAKIVEATESYGKNISGNLGTGNQGVAWGAGAKSPPTNTSEGGLSQYFTAFNGGAATDLLIGDSGLINSASATAAGGGFGVSLGILPGMHRMNAVLSLGESEDEVRVISSPRLVVLNKQSASINQGTPVVVPGVQSQTVGNMTTSTTGTTSEAKTSLTVTPTVTNDGGVLMTVQISRDIAVLAGVGTRSIDTNVHIDSGSTLVLGGIYSSDVKKTSSGFPILRKIPIIGWLFGSEGTGESRSELFIFITPRILNQREAGLVNV
ncbi:MAG: type IV pilus secretin PilQ, partial [Bdellovibrionota bacterium]